MGYGNILGLDVISRADILGIILRVFVLSSTTGPSETLNWFLTVYIKQKKRMKMHVPPVNLLIASASASIDSISKLFVGSS